MIRQIRNNLPLPQQHAGLSRRQVLAMLGTACVAAPLVMTANQAFGQSVAMPGNIAESGNQGGQHQVAPGDAHCAYHFMCMP